jgi:prolyl oligopeptidase
MKNIEDPYLWLEEIGNPKVKKWYMERDKYTRRYLGSLSRKLLKKIKKYYTYPYILWLKTSKLGHYILYSDDKSHKIKLIYPDKDERIIIDSASLGEDVIIHMIYPTDEGRYLAYYYTEKGKDIGRLRVIDVENMELMDEIEGIIWDVIWLDRDKYYYSRFFSDEKTPDGIEPPAERIYLREDGKDEMVYGEGLPPSYFIFLKKSIDHRKALVTIRYGWVKSKVYSGEIDNPSTWRLLYDPGDYICWPIDYYNGKYIIATYDKEGMGRIITIDNGREKELVGEKKYPLNNAVLLKNKIICIYMIDASSTIEVYDINGKQLKTIKFEPPGSISLIHSIGERCIFKYETFYIPYRIYILEDLDPILIDQLEIEGDFEVKDLWVESRDGTKIHGFIVKKRNYPEDKVLAYGYGGFGISFTPAYYPYIIPFLIDGGTFVMANLRGGLEYGEKWHREGMREKKQNVFDDFKSIIKYFKDKGAKVVALGRSNGGLLVGALLTQNPELLDGAIIGYPVLDMLRFHKLYGGKSKTWITEYGDPDNDKDREYLIKYSPYHNIKRRPYPPTLIYTGIHDDRVHPAHAFKFMAKLEETETPCLLRVETRAGHSGATPTIKIEENTDVMAFTYMILGLTSKNI